MQQKVVTQYIRVNISITPDQKKQVAERHLNLSGLCRGLLQRYLEEHPNA